ncbi:MAG: hypothetical protein ACHQ01_00545 [Candidatus Limnocylindrales bacterium]
MTERRIATGKIAANSPEAVLYDLIRADLLVLGKGIWDRLEKLEKQEQMLQAIESHLAVLESQISELRGRVAS